MLPSPDILNDYEYGKFVLSNLAAKRAKQLRTGAPPLVRIDSNHPLTIALAEIAAGKIKPILGEARNELDDTMPEVVSPEERGVLLPGLDEEDEVLVVDSLISDDFSLDDFDSEDHEESEDEEGLVRPASITDLVGDDDEAEHEDVEEVVPEDDTIPLSDLDEGVGGDDEDLGDDSTDV